MAIKKVQLPDNSTQDINDSRIGSADITKWNAQESFYFVQGSSSAAGNATSGSYLSTKWEGTVSGITTPTNGMKIAYRIATNTGVSTAGAVLSIDGGTTYHPVVYNVNSVISTRYSVDSTILLVYNSTQTATAYLTSGTKTTVTGCWQIMDYSASNTDTKVRQYQSGANAAGTSPEYPLLSRYGTTNVNSSYEANYARFHTGATLNTTTGGITAASFKKTGGTSSQFLKADGSVDSNTYLTTAPVTSVNGSTGDVTITVPTKVSDLNNDSGFITGYTETDPVFAASAAHGITSSDISNWNGKQDALVSGTNIKTVNNESLLGDGNLEIQSGGGTEHNLKVSPNSVFMRQLNGQVKSTRIFPFDEIGNATAIIRSLLVDSDNISRYDAGTVLGFYKSSNTYLEAKIDQYNVIVRLVVNGSTVQTTTVGDITSIGLDANGDYAVRYNNDDKTFRFFSYSSGAVTNIASADISSWDLSSLDNVYLVASVNNFFNNVVCNTVLVNCPSILSDYMAVPMNYGLYNVPQGTSYNENIYLAGQGLTMGGTVVETISATDKVISVSNASLSFFSMGPSNLDDRFKWYHLRLKFNSVGSGAYFSSIGNMGPAYFDNNGIETKVKFATDKFYPVEGETYDMYYEFQGKETQSYQRSYAMRVFGDLTFEVSQPYMFNKQIQNLCAEIYDGTGFTGAIPFEGDVFFDSYTTTKLFSPSALRVPLGTPIVDNGNIYMWNGSVWKQINNS